MSDGTPLQLTLELGSGVALGHPWINGEGVIQRLAILDAYGREWDRIVAEMEQDGPADLRDDDAINNGLAYTDGIAHASASQFDTDRRASTTLYSSYDEVRAHTVGGSRPRTKIPIGGGTFKSQMIDVTYVPAKRCTFYLCGDRERIETLLERHFTDIGKHTAKGFGRVNDWDVRELDTDYSLVHPTEHVAMRPLPKRSLSRADDTAMLTWRCPYHYEGWAVECAPPGSEVEPAW